MRKSILSAIVALASVFVRGAHVDPALLGSLVDLTTDDASKVAYNPSSGWDGSPEKLFDNDSNTLVKRWTVPYDIAYTFDAATVVNSYRLTVQKDPSNRAPGVWTFCGSNDFDGDFTTATWVELDSQTTTGWTVNESRIYFFDNTTAYKTYAIRVTSNANPNNNSVILQELELFNATVKIDVTGNPAEFGDFSYEPEYALPGASVTMSSFEGTWNNQIGTVSTTCSGYRLYTRNFSGDWTFWQEGAGTEATFTMPSAQVKVEWQFETTYPTGENAVYVSTTGNDADTGISSDHAFATITHALAALGHAGGRVYLADGTYCESTLNDDIAVSNAVEIVGLSADASKVTVKPADKNHRAFVLNHPKAILRRLTIDAGLSANNNTTSGDNARGGCVYLTDGEILDCIVTGTFNRNGGAYGSVYMDGGHVARCHFTGCYMRGAGLCVYANGGLIEDCLFSGNAWTGNNDGTFMVELAGPATLLNCTVADNHMRAASGVKATHANSRVINCIIAGNTSLNDLTGYVYGGHGECFVNCLTDLEIPSSSGCLVAENVGFVDSANGDFRITVSSPAFEAGMDRTGYSTSSTDKDGNTRVVGTAVDIGCYENKQDEFVCAFSATASGKITPVTASFAAVVFKAPEGSLEYVWDFGDGETETVVNSATVQHIYRTGGTFTVTLTVSGSGESASKTEVSFFKFSPPVIYTSPDNANAAEPYDTEATAASKLATAVEFAEDGAKIVMLPGLYCQGRNDSVKVEKAISILGSTGRPTDVIVSNTVFNSDLRVMQLHNEHALVAGLTMSNGRTGANNGHGATLFFNNGGGTVSNCIIRSGIAGGWASWAGGVSINNGLLTHSIVTGSFTTCPQQNANASWSALAVYLNGTNARMENCLVTDVTAVEVERTGNGEATCMGPLVAVNKGRLANCTVAVDYQHRDGTSTQSGFSFDGGAAIYCASGASVVNCVATGFKRDGGAVVPFGGAGTFTSCAGDAAVDGVDSIVGTPAAFFMDASNGKYHPRVGGPLMNAGTDVALASSTDIQGHPRVVGKAIDIGCYEQNLAGMTIILR